MRRSKDAATLTVLAWNVYQGHNPVAVHHAVATMAHEYLPHLIVLNEATNAGPFKVLGYVPFQLPKINPPGNVQPEDADTAILVRGGIEVRRHRVYRMRMPWKGPDHGLPHEPRVFQAVWVRAGGIMWKVAGGHWPFGPAKDEAKRWTTRWIRRTLPGRPVLFVGDLNAMPIDLEDVLRAARAESAGHRIDRAIHRNCTSTAVHVLGLHGSDHHAVLYTFEAPGLDTTKER